jgi:hypothetical protein
MDKFISDILQGAHFLSSQKKARVLKIEAFIYIIRYEHTAI